MEYRILGRLEVRAAGPAGRPRRVAAAAGCGSGGLRQRRVAAAAGAGRRHEAWREALDLFDQIDHPDADMVRAKIGSRIP